MREIAIVLKLVFVCSLAALVGCAQPELPRTFVVKDYLNHAWQDELVHFDFKVKGSTDNLHLADPQGKPVPCQFSDVVRGKRGWMSGKVWTVVTVEPNGQAAFQLLPGEAPVEAGVALEEKDGALVLSNAVMSVTLAKLPGELNPPAPLTEVPPPLLWVGPAGGQRLGAGKWVCAGAPLQVKRATTEVLERGPVFVRVRQSLLFADDLTYQATITLAARQDAALIVEDSTVDAPGAAFRFSFAPGLQANRVLWHNQWKQTDNAKTWERVNTALSFQNERKVCELRPWSFWWLPDITEWAGFYREGGEHLVGVIATRPSRWSPPGWEGFDRTAIPVTERQNGDLDAIIARWQGFDRTAIPVTERPGSQVDVTLALLAVKKGEGDKQQLTPLHREWALVVGKVAEHVSGEPTAKLRRQLIKYSEFPLDEVKDYGFEFAPANPAQGHPFLLFTKADVERARRQVKEIPQLAAYVQESVRYTTACAGGKNGTLQREGPLAFYTKNYVGNYLVEKLPESYIGTDDPLFGELLAAAVMGLTGELRNTFLEQPSRPAIGAYGPWFSESVMRLLANYDLAAGAGFLTPEQDAAARSALVFGGHVLSHPDYWNNARGLCSANPNMTSSILLPRGMVALFLAGHPRSDEWLKSAEDELTSELENWITEGGAWVEDPGYQSASLDGMFLLAQAIRNVHGRDYFANPKFKATMEYYGFILTPPDPRCPPKKPDAPHPMTLPSIGDMFSGYITCFNGWMAVAAAAKDPAFSARQQFYWKGQNSYLDTAGRAKGMTIALTNPDLPAAAPAELARGFPGFGSIMRTSWTDPKASYVAHRTGPNLHHYHSDFNSFVYHAKGVPLCIDFGNCYAPLQRRESWYHSQVTLGKADAASGELKDLRTLPRTADYSYGESWGGDYRVHRHLLLVKSDDPLGANYVVVRDRTESSKADAEFSWNLWCLSKEPQVQGSIIHFPGQLGIDLDVHVVSPAELRVEKDQWKWDQHIYVWGPFTEEQYGVHVAKKGAAQDYFAVLNPRAEGQGAAKVEVLDPAGAVLKIEHAEGTDYVCFSPREGGAWTAGDSSISGKVALAREYKDGTLRLATISGPGCAAALRGWKLASDGPVALEIRGKNVEGESSGDAHTMTLTLPAGYGECAASLDGKAAAAKRDGQTLAMALPAGYHKLTIKPK